MAWKLALTMGLLVIFAITVLLLNNLLPGPHKATDYLVMGTLATLLCILILFVLNLAMSAGNSDTFYKRRK